MKTIRDAYCTRNINTKDKKFYLLYGYGREDKISDYCPDKESLKFYAPKYYLMISSYDRIHANNDGKTFILHNSLRYGTCTYFDKDKISDYTRG